MGKKNTNRGFNGARTVLIDYLDRATCTLHLISAQASKEEIKCTKAKE